MRPILLPIALAGLFAVPAHADIPAILACAGVTDPQARLKCYDTEAAKLKTDVEQAQQRKFSLFGFTLPFTGEDSPEAQKAPPEPNLGPKEVNQISTQLADWTKDYAGHVTMTLDNGQVWRVEDVRPVPLSHGKGTPIVITRNILGGYYMSVNGRDTRLSVTRIR